MRPKSVQITGQLRVSSPAGHNLVGQFEFLQLVQFPAETILMPRVRWKFINSADPASIVIVHDEGSAEVLRRAFSGALKGPWELKTLKETDVSSPAPEDAPARPVIRPALLRHPKGDAPLPPAETASAPAADSTHGAESQRKSKRFKVRLWVTVMTGAYTFQSATRDVSAGGVALEEKIPSNLFGAYCRIYVQRSTESERVELRCRIFADPRNPRRLKFVDPPSTEIERLMRLIQAQKVADESQ